MRNTFTPQADSKTKSNMRLTEGDALVELTLAHCERFDSACNRLALVKRRSVPQQAAEE